MKYTDEVREEDGNRILIRWNISLLFHLTTMETLLRSPRHDSEVLIWSPCINVYRLPGNSIGVNLHVECQNIESTKDLPPI